VRQDDDVDLVRRHTCAPKLRGQPTLPFRKELAGRRPDAGVNQDGLRRRSNKEGAERQHPSPAIEQFGVAVSADGFDLARDVRKCGIEIDERTVRVAEDMNRDSAEIYA
jgi:hypothetical protein